MKLLEVATNLINEAPDNTILQIQSALKAKGYDLGTTGPNKDGIDGVYGPNTKNAIIQFQKANGISPTGFVGVKTAPLLGTPQMTPYKPQEPSLQSKVASAGQDIKSKVASTGQDIKSRVSSTMGDIKSRVSSTMGDVKSRLTPKPDNVKPEVKPDVKSKIEPEVKPEVKPEIKPEDKEKSGGFDSFIRKISPNLAQLIKAKPLTGKDFSKAQRQVIYNTIQNAIKRGQRKDKGGVTYADYNQEIYNTLDTVKGSASLDDITMIKKSLSDPYFQVATTLGKFRYQLQPNGTYLVTDTYDFSKWNAFTVKKEELKGMSYPQQIRYVKNKDKLSTYHAMREIGYLENPDTAPESEKTKINVVVDPKEFNQRPVTA